MWGLKTFRAGYAQTVGVVFSFLAAVLVFYYQHIFREFGVWVSFRTALVVFFVLGAITVAIAIRNKKLAQETTPRQSPKATRPGGTEDAERDRKAAEETS